MNGCLRRCVIASSLILYGRQMGGRADRRCSTRRYSGNVIRSNYLSVLQTRRLGVWCERTNMFQSLMTMYIQRKHSDFACACAWRSFCAVSVVAALPTSSTFVHSSLFTMVDSSSSHPPSGSSTPKPRFQSQNHTAEDLLKEQTYGLVHLSDFRKRRAEALEQSERSQDGTPNASGAATPDGR